MKRVALILCLAAAGCSDTMRPEPWETAVALCQPHGGVYYASWRMYRRMYRTEANCIDKTTVQSPWIYFKGKDHDSAR